MGKPLGVRVSLWALMARNKKMSILLSWKTAVGAGVGLIVLGFLWIGVGRQRDITYRRLLGDERVELQQNTIPSDVRQWVGQGGGVLGANSSGFQVLLLPKQLHVPILMYHYVEYVKDKGDTIRQSLALTPYTFEEEVKTLSEHGYTFMTNAELAEAFEGKTPLPRKPIVLTFDDGYRDFYTDVYPILKKYNAKATAYIISGFLDYPNNMHTWQLLEIANDGLVEIGAHTVNHAWLKGLAQKTVLYELMQSKKDIEALIARPVVSFAYPYGAFDVPSIQAVAQAGFTSAVSTVPGIDQPQTHRYFLYRLRPGGRTGEALISWLQSVENGKISFMPGQE